MRADEGWTTRLNRVVTAEGEEVRMMRTCLVEVVGGNDAGVTRRVERLEDSEWSVKNRLALLEKKKR